MNDYTPSVDEARARYIDVCRDTDHCRLCDEVGAEFDRMIEAVRAEEREQADREPSEAEELARLRLERLEAVEDFITRHYLDTQMGERVLMIVNGIEEVHRG